ncbi:DNA-binding response regulator, NarL/FixJ family, contains REC and HTH domains [Thermomonospora echinospora]|uniref:DNA-binding response regulator, NarL/FixJ family, contains REC and HTH domains n=1 Tax=Thermomonospora echinospora TaxID=1992 RepID=A0A1H5TQF3_9ACTN|nr:response regulator transcription factor [Thermomonospora echinospora]SEF65016.1 DNA-binding response regulator, NarL/FixJ family, contains REC and HTH domains [Thermomonospora echinospora]
MPDPTRTGILIVDDHALVRDGVREILETQEDMGVVGEASDSHSAVALAAETKPQVVLLDIGIPGDDAVTTVGRIRALSPGTAVVILSMFEGPYLLRSLLDAGIRGYLLKSATRQELVAAIRSVVADKARTVLSVSQESLLHLRGPAEDVLTPLEREILQLTAEALSNAQIAARLSLTEAAVKRHLGKIFGKLGAVSRIDAVNKAAAASLITVATVPPAPAAPEGGGRRGRRRGPAESERNSR